MSRDFVFFVHQISLCSVARNQGGSTTNRGTRASRARAKFRSFTRAELDGQSAVAVGFALPEGHMCVMNTLS